MTPVSDAGIVCTAPIDRGRIPASAEPQPATGRSPDAPIDVNEKHTYFASSRTSERSACGHVCGTDVRHSLDARNIVPSHVTATNVGPSRDNPTLPSALGVKGHIMSNHEIDPVLERGNTVKLCTGVKIESRSIGFIELLNRRGNARRAEDPRSGALCCIESINRNALEFRGQFT